MRYNEKGEELPDDTPVEVPLRFRQFAETGDILQGMLQRLREEQEKEIAETSGEFYGEEVEEVFDLPTRYELDHDAEERALLYAENAERIRMRRLGAKGDDDEDRGNRGREKDDRDRAGRDGGKSGKARRETDGNAYREGRRGEDGVGGESGESEG